MNDIAMLTNDDEARVAALDISRSFIVQAPAGSGKTELLIQRYLKLLAIVDNPEEVVAITFTRKAAAEMQRRVAGALCQRRDGVSPGAAHEQLTSKLAGDALSRSESLGWNLIANPRRMRIITLDALNASIARALPLSSPGTGSRVIVGAEIQSLYRAASVATLDWISESGALSDATIEVLLHLDNNTRLFTSYLSQMLGTRDQWLPFMGSGDQLASDSGNLRHRLEANLDFAVSSHLQRTAALLSHGKYAELIELFDFAARNVIESGNRSSPIADLAGQTGLPPTDAGSTVQWRAIAELLLTQKGDFRKKVDKRQGFPPEDKGRKEQVQSLLRTMSEHDELASLLHSARYLPPVEYSQDQWQVLQALFRLLPLAVTELKRLFTEQGVSDHIDVALNASAVLGSADEPSDIALLLDYQLKHLLVDEMQDTSAAQYQMLRTLTAGWEFGDGRSLCCVGDPMQSIYRFRNAEVGQFLLAKDQGIGQVKLTPLVLRRNFRSGEFLVHWFNTVFSMVLADSDDPMSGAVTYAEAVPVTQQSGLGRCETHAIFGADSHIEATEGSRLIGEILASDSESTLAVLVRGRTQLPPLLAELRRAGIDYSAVEIDKLTDLPEIIDVLSLTRAATHLGDRIAWMGVLRAPWIGLDWTDMHALMSNDLHGTVWEKLNNGEPLLNLSKAGRTAILDALPTLKQLTAPRRSTRLRDLIERVWLTLGGPAIVADDYAVDNVYQFFDVISKLETAGSITDIGELESILDIERVSTSNSSRLQIMTMHRAKGLQFDHVMLYGLGRQSGRGDRRVLSWFDLASREGVDRKIISPIGPRSVVDNDPIHRYIELTETDKDRNELARLLYVACTRAKTSLHLLGHTVLTADEKSFRPPRSDSLLHLIWPAVEPEFKRQFTEKPKPAVEQDIQHWLTPELRRFADPWTLPDLTAITPPDDNGVTIGVGDTTGSDADRGKEKAVEFYWVGEGARLAGTIVHRWLQRLADAPADQFAYSNDVSYRWLREMGIDEVSAPPILDRVERAVTSTLNDDKGRWILDGHGHSELRLSGISDGEFVNVVLDRVRVDNGGTHWIIDYKTSSHEGGDLENFLQEEQRRYQPQLKRYANLYFEWTGAETRCALYFPLLQRFLEVPA